MKIEVHLQGGLRKIIDITPGATVGATIGTNVYNADGTLFVPSTGGGGQTVAVTSWELILNIPPNVAALAAFSGTGLYTITGPGTSVGRSVTGTAGRIGVTNGDGVAGNPTVDLVLVTDTGVGAALVKITVDGWGRVTGTEAAGLGDLDDVDLTTTPPADGNVLTWDAVAGKWVPDVGGGGGIVSVVAGTGIDVDSTDPANPVVSLDAASIASLALADSAVQSIVAGANITVDDTDPQNPVVSASGGSGGSPSIAIQAAETLPAKSFVSITPIGAVLGDASEPGAGKAASGFVAVLTPSGAIATVILSGPLSGFTGLTPGEYYVLSDTVLGGILPLSAAPNDPGDTFQILGVAFTPTILSVAIEPAIIRGT